MIVVILVLIWVVALTPFALRRLSEHQIATSVSKFRAATGMLRRTYPRLVSLTSDLGVAAPSFGGSTKPSALHRRRQVERAKRQVERRRHLFLGLVGGTLGTAILGAIPHLHVLWDLSIAGVILTAGYLGALANIARQPSPGSLVRSRAPSVRPYAGEHVDERIAAAGGGTPLFVSQMPRHPAFVVVDPS